MSAATLPKPGLVAHADWSVDPAKRWVCAAHRTDGGTASAYAVAPPRPVGDLATYFERLRHASVDGSVLAGFDFPLGVPIEYARRAGIASFLEWLPGLGRGAWSFFYEICADASDIGLRRPFYPQRPGGTRHRHLCAALSVADIDALRRRSERRTPGRNAAAPLFWTLGGQQVGRAAITGWRDLLQPAIEETETPIRLWPFEGCLAELCAPGTVVVAETYPAESGLHIGLPAPGRKWSKRLCSDRAGHAGTMLSWARGRRVALDAALRRHVEGGFGDEASGEDRFDATVGAMGMLEVVLAGRPEMPPLAREVRRIEGWILGQSGSG